MDTCIYRCRRTHVYIVLSSGHTVRIFKLGKAVGTQGRQSPGGARQRCPAGRDALAAGRSREIHPVSAAVLQSYFAAMFSLLRRRSGHCQGRKGILACKQGCVSLRSPYLCRSFPIYCRLDCNCDSLWGKPLRSLR